METNQGIGAMNKELKFLASAYHLAESAGDSPHAELGQTSS